ncbi:Alanine racemase domain-containing protein [Burkholderiales bacterium 8X]|nr:Alanine racemase domain-containing protein [Burkholderiales bacterium 8X]
MFGTGLPPTPFLALDLDRFEHNVRRIADAVVRHGQKRWRPHAKSIRSTEIVRRLIAAGAQGVTCATAREARVMIDGGIEDVLIASQVAQPADLESVALLNRRGSVAIAVDGRAQLALADAAARRAETRIPVVIEVDIGLGRAGVSPGSAGIELARLVQAHPHLHFAGFMAWEGHATRIADPAEKRLTIEHAVRQLTDTAAACRAAGMPTPIVSCGGTGTFDITSELDGVTELQAGGGVFGDIRYREEFHVPLEPALTLRSTVLARPTARRIVCDAGWKSLAVYPTAPRPVGLPAGCTLAHSAEHLAITLPADADSPAVGERIDLQVGYADATTFLHRLIVGFRGDRLETQFELAGTPSSMATTGASNHES